jgi:hypothetical protein
MLGMLSVNFLLFLALAYLYWLVFKEGGLVLFVMAIDEEPVLCSAVSIRRNAGPSSPNRSTAKACGNKDALYH